jgi:ergothioneine biosynthesis protein EgtB
MSGELARPLYWSADLEREFSLGGWRDIVGDAPVVHVSYFEADAFARWANARLPYEAEWEHVAAATRVRGNFLDDKHFRPMPATSTDADVIRGHGLHQLWGDAWEWTASPYMPYPGYRPLDGALGEYNGKFMSGQMVVRGGSCASWRSHLRATYRSFFYPRDRWQFLGFRLARNR